jgi:transcriptional regulator with XRE-family HTH domain
MSLTSQERKFVKKLGNNIVAIRKKKGIKQKELSDILDMDDGSLRRIESGRTNPTTTTLLSIVNGLKIEFKDLFDFPKDSN